MDAPDKPQFPALMELLKAAADSFQRDSPGASRGAVLEKARLFFLRALVELGPQDEATIDHFRKITRGH